MYSFKKLIALISPPSCSFCRKWLKRDNQIYICDECLKTLPYIKGRTCERCGTLIGDMALSVCCNCRINNRIMSGGYIPLRYTSSARNAILAMKFHNKPYFARSFAFLMADKIIPNMEHIDFITFVPSSNKTLRKRGYNQAELIAKELSRIMHIPLKKTLGRFDATIQQSSLSMKLRLKNAKKSFYKLPNVSLCGNALLIDDVLTTGATMDSCSKLLISMGCDKVFVSAAAATIKD